MAEANSKEGAAVSQPWQEKEKERKKKKSTGSRTGRVKNKESYNSLVKNHLSASVGRHHPMIRRQMRLLNGGEDRSDPPTIGQRPKSHLPHPCFTHARPPVPN